MRLVTSQLPSGASLLNRGPVYLPHNYRIVGILRIPIEVGNKHSTARDIIDPIVHPTNVTLAKKEPVVIGGRELAIRRERCSTVVRSSLPQSVFSSFFRSYVHSRSARYVPELHATPGLDIARM